MQFKKNYLVSERIYEYFSKHAGLYEMDENIFEQEVKKVLNEAKEIKIKNVTNSSQPVPAGGSADVVMTSSEAPADANEVAAGAAAPVNAGTAANGNIAKPNPTTSGGTATEAAAPSTVGAQLSPEAQ